MANLTLKMTSKVKSEGLTNGVHVWGSAL